MLGKLVDESDAVLAPLAEHRKDLGRLHQARRRRRASATAKQGDALEQNFARFPAFLQELGPAADRLGAFADQTTPAIANLSSQARGGQRTATSGSARWRQQATPAFKTLGKVADQGRTDVPEDRAARPTAQRRSARRCSRWPGPRPRSRRASTSTGGIESLMRFIYFYTGAVNGEDACGHYTRAR